MDKEFESFLVKDDLPEFTLAEILDMERSFRKMGETSFSMECCRELATKFSSSLHRSGKSSINGEQVHGWFQDRQKQVAAKSIASPAISKELVAHSTAMGNPFGITSPVLFGKTRVPSRKRATYITLESSQKSREESVAELTELMFEARSSKDFAWFDVASFLNYRVAFTGELEVRVRFAGFGNEEDEWVNVKRAVRKRSIPLEDSECQRVDVGDLVLCYRECNDHALYCDAHIVDIERRLHDIMGCRCIFVVRYDHDYVEDKVQLNRLCCRPT